MSLPDSFLDELRGRADLPALIGRQVRLVKRGREYSGLCPFHNEKSPSFTVNPDKGFYHCFGCGAHGDVLAFVMASEHLTFREAVERLAGDVGMALPDETPAERAAEARRAGLREALEAAADLWQSNLQGPGGADARAYLERRGIGRKAVEQFRLGWAPAGLPAGLLCFGETLLLEAGLLRRREDGGVGPLFRSRLMFPITDRRGRVIAFGGRTLGDGQPKYLNSPASPLFDKAASLYGLALAREAAGAAGRVVVVEGYLDVIQAHQAGLAEVVAPLGTAVTEQQLEQMFRLAPEVVLCLDGDAAGQHAAARAVEVALPLLSAGRRMRLAPLPTGDDPDSLIRSQGIAALRERLETAPPLSEALWQMVAATAPPGDSPELRLAFERRMLEMLSRIPDGLARRVLLGEFRRRLRDWAGEPGPVLIWGRDKVPPPPADAGLLPLWERLCQAPEVAEYRAWAERQGVRLEGVDGLLGGIGFARGKRFTARDEGAWPGPRVPLWEMSAQGAGLMVLPVWEGAAGESALLDLVAWHLASGTLARLTGAATVIGQGVIDEALGYEARGLPRPVRAAGLPLLWLREIGGGRASVLVVDWHRCWEALGGLSLLVAVDGREAAQELEKATRPPRPAGPEVGYEMGDA